MKQYLLLIFVSAALWSCGGEVGSTKSADKKEHEKIVNHVDTMVLRSCDFRAELISNGRLRARKKSDLSFSGSGYVMELNVTNGGYVTVNEVVARLNNEDAKLHIDQAKQALSKARLDLQDALLGFGYSIADSAHVPPQTMVIAQVRSGYQAAQLSLTSAQLEMDRRTIRAPFSGIIANLKTKLHENPKGEFFCSIIDESSFDVDFSVIESEVGKITVGTSVYVTPFSNSTSKYSGAIKSINPTVDDKGQVVVTATIVNSDKRLLDGMNVKVFVNNVIKNRLVVPKSAVLIRDNLDVLFTVDKDGKAHWTYVYIEVSNSTQHAVVANKDRGAELKAGDVVITSGNLNLADLAEVEIR